MEKIPILFAIVILILAIFILGLGFAIAKIGLVAIVWALAVIGFFSLLAKMF